MQTTGALPKHVEIAEALMRRVAAGLLPDGTRLPPERQMAHEWGVAVGTLRKSLAKLEEEGLLERIQGSGNYIRQKDGAQSLYRLFRLELVSGGGLPTAQILDVARSEKPHPAIDFGHGDSAHRIRRLRRLDGHPVAVEEIWFDGAQAESLTAADLSDSLYHTYATRFGLEITRIEDRVSIGTLPDWAAGMPITPGTMTGFIERWSWARGITAPEAAPVEYSRTWFDAGRAMFVARDKGRQD